MEIFKDRNFNYYIDQDLFNHINSIWLNFDNPIPNDSNVFFLKNSTIPRLITDYSNKNINRVIKMEKATHCIIQKFDLDSYPRYYDRDSNSITNDDTKQIVYSINRMKAEEIETIKQIAAFVINGLNVSYINQNLLNESLNNGFIIDNDNYTILKELVDSDFSDNHVLAYNMIKNSDLVSNLDWLLYIYHNKSKLLSSYDDKYTVYNFFKDKHNIDLNHLLSNFDLSISKIVNDNVKEKMIQLKKHEFFQNISSYFTGKLKTSMFELIDFQIKIKDNEQL
jgi:hypothetical protein